MYKVLIVDDDITVREYLRRIIQWEEHGFELVGEAINGRDALLKVETLRPDILILDLSMPVMSGLDLLKIFSEKNIYCKVVVFSCHDDYDNVIDAMKNGAVDFILKHRMKEADLISVLEQAAARIEKESNEQRELSNLKKNADISMQVMRKNLINDLVKGHLLEPESITKRIEDLKETITLNNVVVCAVGIDGFGQGINDNIVTSFTSYLNNVEAGRKDCIYGADDNGLFYIILSYQHHMSYLLINKDIYDFLNGLMIGCKNELNISITIGVSDLCSDTSELPRFFSNAQYAYNCSFYKGKGRIIHFNEVLKYEHKPLKPLKEYEKVIHDAIINNPESISDVLNTIYFEMEQGNTSLDYVKDFNIQIISLLKKILGEFGINDEDVYGNNCFPYNYVNMLGTIDELKSWLCMIMNKIADIISRRNDKSKHNELIAKAIRYIEENYMNDITLDDAARYVNLSKTYFSSLFKKEVNENLIEYITRLRIEKARELLETTDLKVYNIALSVGIDNYRYFSKVFREATGMTPVKYKSVKKG